MAKYTFNTATLSSYRVIASCLVTADFSDSYNRPINSRMIRIKRTKPIPPVGKYPQFRLWGQVGNAPNNSKTRTTIKMVPNIVLLLSAVKDLSRTPSTTLPMWTLRLHLNFSSLTERTTEIVSFYQGKSQLTCQRRPDDTKSASH